MAGQTHHYIALLRAVNVGGRVVKMDAVRKLFESAGLSDVRTYIQTGNVLFTSSESRAERLARQIEQKLAAFLGYPVSVFVLTPAQLRQAAANNPFEPDRLEKEQRCHLMFLSDKPDKAHLQALKALKADEYRFAVKGAVLYYAYSREHDGSRRRNIDFEKILGVSGTARTWKVVDTLIKLTEK